MFRNNMPERKSNEPPLSSFTAAYIKELIPNISLSVEQKNTSDKGEKAGLIPFSISNANNTELREAIEKGEWSEAGEAFICCAQQAITQSPTQSPSLSPEILLDLVKETESEQTSHVALALVSAGWDSEDFTAAIVLLLNKHYEANNQYQGSNFLRNDVAPLAPLLLALMRLQLRLDAEGQDFFKQLIHFYKPALQIIIYDLCLYLDSSSEGADLKHTPLTLETQSLLTIIASNYLRWLLTDTTLEKLPKFFKQICHHIYKILSEPSSNNLPESESLVFVETYFNFRMLALMVEEGIKELWLPIPKRNLPINKETSGNLTKEIFKFINKKELNKSLTAEVCRYYFENKMDENDESFIALFTKFYNAHITKEKAKKNKSSDRNPTPEQLRAWFHEVEKNRSHLRKFKKQFVNEFRKKIMGKFKIKPKEFALLLMNPAKREALTIHLRAYTLTTFVSPIRKILSNQNEPQINQELFITNSPRPSPRKSFEEALVNHVANKPKPPQINDFLLKLANSGKELSTSFQCTNPEEINPDNNEPIVPFVEPQQLRRVWSHRNTAENEEVISELTQLREANIITDMKFSRSLSNLPDSITWFTTQIKLLCTAQYEQDRTVFKKMLKQFIQDAQRDKSEENQRLLSKFISDVKKLPSQKTHLLFFKRSKSTFFENEIEKSEFLAWLNSTISLPSSSRGTAHSM